MKIVVVLSHKMKQGGKLENESKARADLAIKTFFNNNCDFILTLGWDYRQDSNIPIAHAFSSYIKDKRVSAEKIISDINSRDTVGDAIFSKIILMREYNPKKIYVVSSDYHIQRVEIIFRSIYQDQFDLEFLSCHIDKDKNHETKELKSLNAFKKTFEDIDFSNNEILLKRLSSQHPFYNGDIFPKI